jgi:hypothetical protein
MYLDYSEYKNMGGTLDETAFNNFEFEAETYVNWYTFRRLVGEAEYPEELARCMYQLIMLAKLKADALLLGKQTTVTVDGEGNKTTTEVSTYIKGQSNDGVSVDYNAVDAGNLFELLASRKSGNVLEDTVRRYLSGVRRKSDNKLLTYRGLYPDE